MRKWRLLNPKLLLPFFCLLVGPCECGKLLLSRKYLEHFRRFRYIYLFSTYVQKNNEDELKHQVCRRTSWLFEDESLFSPIQTGLVILDNIILQASNYIEVVKIVTNCKWTYWLKYFWEIFILWKALKTLTEPRGYLGSLTSSCPEPCRPRSRVLEGQLPMVYLPKNQSVKMSARIKRNTPLIIEYKFHQISRLYPSFMWDCFKCVQGKRPRQTLNTERKLRSLADRGARLKRKLQTLMKQTGRFLPLLFSTVMLIIRGLIGDAIHRRWETWTLKKCFSSPPMS